MKSEIETARLNNSINTRFSGRYQLAVETSIASVNGGPTKHRAVFAAGIYSQEQWLKLLGSLIAVPRTFHMSSWAPGDPGSAANCPWDRGVDS